MSTIKVLFPDIQRQPTSMTNLGRCQTYLGQSIQERTR